MELRIEFVGDVRERSELLNGTQSVDVEGAGVEGDWSLSGSFSWNLGLLDYAGEGDLVLTRHDGAEIFGTLTRTEATAGESAEVEFRFTIAYEIDGGTQEFEGASGTAHAVVTLAGNTFRGYWTVRLDPRG
jgi:hypothetical protein